MTDLLAHQKFSGTLYNNNYKPQGFVEVLSSSTEIHHYADVFGNAAAYDILPALQRKVILFVIHNEKGPQAMGRLKYVQTNPQWGEGEYQLDALFGKLNTCVDKKITKLFIKNYCPQHNIGMPDHYLGKPSA